MGLNVDVFQEPRGVMRIIQFVFAIWAFAKTVDYSNKVTLNYCTGENSSSYATLEFSYPYELDRIHTTLNPCLKGSPRNFSLVGDFSSDAEFFVATGVISMLYCMGISVVYVMFGAMYESDPMVPMADFLATLVLAVLWLSGSAAWANGIVGLKSVTTPENIISWEICKEFKCSASTGSFSGLNISITLGFLNFFLWAFDLWFLYKETQWFKDAAKTTVPSSHEVSAA